MCALHRWQKSVFPRGIRFYYFSHTFYGLSLELVSITALLNAAARLDRSRPETKWPCNFCLLRVLLVTALLTSLKLVLLLFVF